VQKRIGDVHLAWENEAHLEVQEAGSEKLEIVYPSRSIRAEPHVAIVDENVDRRGTRATADAYLRFLYTDAGQRIIGKHFYRPINPSIEAEFSSTLPKLSLFGVDEISGGWESVQKRFFAEGGIFDRIYARR
jgi:sulfate transport system substrate-binding protein